MLITELKEKFSNKTFIEIKHDFEIENQVKDPYDFLEKEDKFLFTTYTFKGQKAKELILQKILDKVVLSLLNENDQLIINNCILSDEDIIDAVDYATDEYEEDLENGCAYALPEYSTFEILKCCLMLNTSIGFTKTEYPVVPYEEELFNYLEERVVEYLEEDCKDNGEYKEQLKDWTGKKSKKKIKKEIEE